MIFLLALLLAELQPQTVKPPGISAPNAQAVQGVTGGIPVPVSGSLSVSGTADTPGNTATFNAVNVCTSVLTAGEQSVGFHLTAGALDATLTPYVTNQTGAINCATAGTCTAKSFSTGSTIIVTNPNGVKDVGINVDGGTRQVQVCTTTFNSGSATGAVTATFLQAASSGGGGGSVTQGTSPWIVAGGGTAGTAASGVVTVQGIASMTAVKVDGSAVTQPVSGTVTTTPPANASTNVAQMAGTTTDTNSGAKSAGTLRVVLATDQPALTNKLLVTPDSVALPANQSVNVAQVNGITTQTGAGTAGTGTQRVAIADSDGVVLATANSGRLQVDVVTGGGSNASVSATGAAPPASATYAGASVTTAAPSYTTGQMSALSLNTTGGLRVDGSGVTQPVSGTVTTTPPANASTNVAQVNGTTTDTNSGTKSAGTLRVVLATDQPALTNKLLVTPDSVALPANQSVNVSQINAVTPLMGNGTTGTGSQRVTIASDNTAFTVNAAQSGTWTVQPGNTANTTAWKVDGSAVTQPTNQTQVAGTAIDVNTGNASAGTQRVVLASNQPTIPVTQGGAATIFAGQQPLQPYAVAAALPSQAAKQVCFRNLSTSPDYVWLGSSTSVNSTNGQPFAPGEGDCRNIANANQLFFFTMAGATIGYDGTN